MEKKQLNPWTWQDKFGFSQAWKVEGAGSIVFISGQVPVSSEGNLVGGGDFVAQTGQVFENLQAVLEQAGATFDAVVRVTVYLTDISRLPDYARVKSEFVAGEQPASTAIEVSALALPGMMIELDAIAVL